MPFGHLCKKHKNILVKLLLCNNHIIMAKDKKQAALGFIFITLLIDFIGFGIIIPGLPSLIQGLTHSTISETAKYGGWLVFAYASMQFLCSPVLGNLSDKYGRRPILLFSLFGFGIDYLLLAFAPSIMWLFVGRLIAGITGASITTASAYIADISTPENRAKNFGMVGAAFGLGFILGPLIGGFLSEIGLRIPFFAAAGLSLLNWLYGYFVLPESLSKENRRQFEWKRANPIGSFNLLNKYSVIAGLVLSITLIYIAAHAVQTTWSYYTIEKFKWNQRMIGISLTVIGCCIAVVQGLIVRVLIPKLGQEKSVYIGLALYTMGFVLFAFASSTWMMFAFTGVYCLGGIAGPSIQGLISTHVPANEQGELQGALTSLMSATSVIGPLIMTNIFAFFTSKTTPVYLPSAPFLLGAALTLVSTILAYRSLRTERIS
jgi:DHA1 family tetracycline resistance protein-like MFS transporter